MYIVDSQVHVWAAEAPERPWPESENKPHRPVPFSADDLLREMDAAGVHRAALVPATWDGGRNDLALAAARLHPERFAVMGRLNVDARDARDDDPRPVASRTKMKNIFLGLSLMIGAAPAFAETPSHCGTAEQIVYSCQIKDSAKVVSLCASKELSANSGYLQYRFGRPHKSELEFPNARQNSQRRFQYAHYLRFQVDRTEVSFKNGGFEYALYSYYEGEEKPPKSETGVRVRNTVLPCGSTAINKLSTLKGVVSCNEVDPLTGCK
jgi:hypothetical protein